MIEESLVSNSILFLFTGALDDAPVVFKKLGFSKKSYGWCGVRCRMESHLETIVYRVHLFEAVRGLVRTSTLLSVLCSLT